MKYSPPPDSTDETEIEQVLQQLYRRKQVVQQLIQALEMYNGIQNQHQAVAPQASGLGFSQHVH